MFRGGEDWLGGAAAPETRTVGTYSGLPLLFLHGGNAVVRQLLEMKQPRVCRSQRWWCSTMSGGEPAGGGWIHGATEVEDNGCVRCPVRRRRGLSRGRGCRGSVHVSVLFLSKGAED